MTPARQPHPCPYMTARQPHPCPYMRTLEEAGDFCIIKDDWVGTKICEDCIVSTHTPAAPATIIGKQSHEAFEDAKFPVFVQGTGWISKHDAERMFAETAAKAAREQVLDVLFKDRVKQGGRADGFEFYIIGVKTVESLRGGGAP